MDNVLRERHQERVDVDITVDVLVIVDFQEVTQQSFHTHTLHFAIYKFAAK